MTALTRRQQAILAVAEAIRAAHEAVIEAEEARDELLDAIDEESAEDLPLVAASVVRELSDKSGWGTIARELSSIYSDVERREAAEDV